jgi:hypothetical protein
MSGSARWLTSRAVGHVAVSGLRLGGEQWRMRTGPHQIRSGHMSVPDPVCVLFKARVCSVLGPWDSPVGDPDPYGGDPDSIPGVRLAHVEIQDQPWGSGLYIQGSGTNSGGPDCISEGPALSREGPDLLLIPWSISPSLDTWRLRTRPCGGVGRCCGP